MTCNIFLINLTYKKIKKINKKLKIVSRNLKIKKNFNNISKIQLRLK